MKTLLIQYNTKEENQKILCVFSEKPLNFARRRRKKTKKNQAERRFKTFLLA